MDPGLFVGGVGNISLPLTVDNAKAIMKISAQSPFGRGTKTVVDTSFRNTKELNPDKFQLRNSAWSAYLEDVISRLRPSLGLPDDSTGMTAILYKLLLYEKGAMFKPHRE